MSLASLSPQLRLGAFPRHAGAEDYATAAAELEERLSALPGLVAVYRAGSVSAPGISDLDYVVVVDGQRPLPSVWSQLSRRTRYVAMHSPALVERHVFPRHPWIASLDPLRLVHGEAIAPEPRPFERYSTALLASEGAIAVLLRSVRSVAAGRLKVRPFLCELKSLAVDLDLANLDRNAAPVAWSVVDRVAGLRRSWFELSDPSHAVRELATDAITGLADAIRGLSELASALGAPPSSRSLHLAAPWSNVTLAPGDELDVRVRRPRGAKAVLGRAATPSRIEAMIWRRTQVEIALPARTIGLLAGDAAPMREFHSDREDLLRVQRELLAASGHSYSPIGFASIYAGE